MSQPFILLVEDEKHISEIVKHRLEKAGLSVTTALNADTAIEYIQNREFDVILLDIMLPGRSGLDILKEVKSSSALSEVIIVIASESLEIAVEGIKQGAFDYISKPINFELLERSIKKALERTLRARQDLAVHRMMRGKFPAIVNQSAVMQKVLDLVGKAAQVNSPILILGETGTGKELIAKAVHLKSQRATGSFVPINCGGLPESLIESELFGHEKGAFTGATETHRGLFEIAHRGTIFLDEIGEMSSATQSKLLRVLESGEFRRIGGRCNLYTDARVIAATNRDLSLMIKEGKFREDLYYRLYTIVINLPPLRERKEDIEPLTKYFIDIMCMDTGNKRRLSTEAIKAIEGYSWPGNVRELRNVIERLVLVSDSELVGVNDLPEEILTGKQPSLPSNNMSLAEIEKFHIERILSKSKGNRRAAAKILGISEMTLYRKLKEYKFTSHTK